MYGIVLPYTPRRPDVWSSLSVSCPFSSVGRRVFGGSRSLSLPGSHSSGFLYYYLRLFSASRILLWL